MSFVLLDPYSRPARLYPAMVALAPAAVTLAATAPSVLGWMKASIGAGGVAGLLGFAVHLARSEGKKVEERLKRATGGPLTAQYLRHRDGRIDAVTKARYHRFLESKIGTPFPTATEEDADPGYADQIYDSGVRFLLDYTRDRKRYPLVFKELVNYGYRRNLRGLRRVAVLAAIPCFLAPGVMMALDQGDTLLLASAAGFATIEAAAMLAWVDDQWVLGAAHDYALRLLEACETKQKRNKKKSP